MVFLVSHMLYKMIRDNVFNKINIAFFVTIILFAFIFIKEQDAFAISNKNHVEELTLNYKDELQNELAKSGRNVEVKVNGEEIYKTICSSCHAFDKKLVGPPHRDVLPKYIGKKAALVKFILNPVKVNPDYPAMPKQNLTPREAEAVADYMLKELAKKLKK